MKKFVLFLILSNFWAVPVQAGNDAHEPSAVELQMACNRLHSAKDLRDEWELDFKQANEKWLEVKQIESAFEPLENCQEKTNAFHQAIVRTESLLAKEAADAEEELNTFSSEGQKCKSKEKAERLRIVHNRMNSKVEEFRTTAVEAASVHKKEVALAEILESVRKLPSEIDPKIAAMKERLNNALRANKLLQKNLDEVVRLEKKYEGERIALVVKYTGTKLSAPPPQTCDKGNAAEWITETERLTSQIKEMIERSGEMKPVLVSTLKCKPFVDDALLDQIKNYPKKLSLNVEGRRGVFVTQRCLATAGFYDEVSQSVDQGDEAEKNRRRMKEKEDDDTRRASSSPTLRRQNEEKRQVTETASVDGRVR